MAARGPRGTGKSQGDEMKEMFAQFLEDIKSEMQEMMQEMKNEISNMKKS
jgi:gas vesicle protein